MADQEFLASFTVEIDETGLERLQEALTQNTQMAEDLAAAFDAAREAVNGFFSGLSFATLDTGELNPYEQLKGLAETGIEFRLELDADGAEEELETFVENTRRLFAETRFPLNADGKPARGEAEETVSFLQELFGGTILPLNEQGKKVRQEGQSVLDELLRMYGSTELPLNADASGVLQAGQAALKSLQDLYSSTTLTVNVQEVTSTTTTASGEELVSSNVSEGKGTGSGLGSGTGESNSISVMKPSSGLSLISIQRAATGGRFSSPTKAEIAEDGDPEYVIPVKKEPIAVPLLQQLIGELSAGARELLSEELSMKPEQKESLEAGGSTAGNVPGFEPVHLNRISEALSGLPEMLASASVAAVPVITQNNNQSVQAPVSIQVTAPGTDPEAVGRSIYNVTEQYLLRTLQSAMSS